MADFSVNSPRHHRAARPGRVEHLFYFAPVFLLALPFALAGYGWSVLRHARRPATGPIARAKAEADQIVPMIFRG